MEDKISFGIDLGTTNSCISMIRSNSTLPEIIPLDGRNTIPSCVMLNEDGTLTVGREAYEHRYEKSTIYSVKRLMGTDKKIVLLNGDARKEMTPIEVSAEILKAIVSKAEDYIGKGIIKKVTITVPAHFNDAQRRATKEAGEMAGLEVVGIINEPTSAGLLYGLDNAKSNQTILVYDLGGGTFDVSILRVTKELKSFPLLGINTNGEYNSTSINIIGNDGDVALGGDDVDQYVTNYVLEKIAEGASLTVDRVKELIGLEGLEELKLRLEKAKKVSQGLIIYELEGRGKFEIPILGEEVEEKCYRPIFDRTYELVARAMASTGVTSIDRIVLVGGSTKSHIIQKMLKEKFPHLHIMNSFEPDLSVALGASISTATSLGISKVATITDVVPMSIGVLADVGDNAKEYVKILKKDKSLPCIEEMEFNIRDTTQAISITVVQGESTFSLQTLLTIGNLQIQPEQYNGNSLTIGFKCDLNGVLSCYAIIGEKVMPIEIEYSANSKSKNTSDVIEGLDKLDKGQKHFFEMHLKKLVNAGLTNEELAEWTPEVVLGGFKDATAKFKELIAKH